jgi:hypothetical protein
MTRGKTEHRVAGVPVIVGCGCAFDVAIGTAKWNVAQSNAQPFHHENMKMDAEIDRSIESARRVLSQLLVKSLQLIPPRKYFLA